MRIEIPGYKTMDLKYLILDYNGTIAKDGIIPESVKERLKKLSGIYEIYVLTADTHGTARKICEGLPLKIQTFPGNAAAEEKRKIIEQLGGKRCIGRRSVADYASLWNRCGTVRRGLCADGCSGCTSYV